MVLHQRPARRRQAETYLRRLTGAQVRIRQAQFSLFGGIKLTGVRVYVRLGRQEEDIFEAREVYLRHKPLSLLSGTLRVDEIVCVAPVLTVTTDVNTQQRNTDRLFAGSWTAATQPADDREFRELPTLRLRNGELRFVDSIQGTLWSVGNMPALSVVAQPQTGAAVYDFSIEQASVAGQPAFKALGMLDMRNGRVSLESYPTLEQVNQALPKRYREWYNQYAPQGHLAIAFEGGSDPASQRAVVDLQGVNLRTPPEQGGLELTDLRGRLVFTQDGIRIRDVTGKLPRAGDATLHLNGSIDGYGQDSPLAVTIRSDDLRLPLSLLPEGPPGQAVRRLQEELGPAGLLAVQAQITRVRAGPLAWSGQVELHDVGLRPNSFPYAVDGVRGRIVFSEQAIQLEDVRGRHGQATVSAAGKILRPTDRPYGELRLTLTDLSLDDALAAALDKPSRTAWDTFRPSGVCQAGLVFQRTDGADEAWHNHLSAQFDGRTSMRFSEFPYPLEAVTGEMTLDDVDRLTTSIRATHGAARFVVSASATGVGADSLDATAKVQITDLPLDDALAAALPGHVQPAYHEFHPAGTADVTGTFHYLSDHPTDYDVTATLKDVALTYDGFPYSLDGAVGVVRFTPSLVTVERILGRHGPARIAVSGHVSPDRDPAGLDLQFDATAMPLDDKLYRALPPAAGASGTR